MSSHVVGYNEEVIKEEMLDKSEHPSPYHAPLSPLTTIMPPISLRMPLNLPCSFTVEVSL